MSATSKSSRRALKTAHAMAQRGAVAFLADCDSRLILVVVTGRGPAPDRPHLIDVMLNAPCC